MPVAMEFATVTVASRLVKDGAESETYSIIITHVYYVHDNIVPPQKKK